MRRTRRANRDCRGTVLVASPRPAPWTFVYPGRSEPPSPGPGQPGPSSGFSMGDYLARAPASERSLVARLLRDRRGAFAVEVALLAPFLIVGALAALDLGIAEAEWGQLQFATQGSARANDAGWGQAHMPSAQFAGDGPGCYVGTKAYAPFGPFFRDNPPTLSARACWPVAP